MVLLEPDIANVLGEDPAVPFEIADLVRHLDDGRIGRPLVHLDRHPPSLLSMRRHIMPPRRSEFLAWPNPTV
jgi:hypothetical protein